MRVSLKPWLAGVAAALLLTAGCEKSDEEKLQAIREKIPGKKFIPVGETNKLVLPELQEKAKQKPDDFQAQFELASVAREAGDIPVAIAAAKEAVRLDPTSNPAKEIYAQCLHVTGELEQATAQWEAIVASGLPYSPIVGSNLANIYKQQGRLDEAEKLYRKAMEARDSPHMTLFRVNLADLLIKKQAYDEADQILRDGLAEDARMSYAHQLLGRIAFLKGEFEVAASEMRLEIEQRPKAWEAYYLLALSEGRKQPPDLAKAMEAFEIVGALRPGETAYFKVLLADLHTDAGEAEKGKLLASEALNDLAAFREDQRNAAYHALAKAYQKLGDAKTAAEFQMKFRQSLGQTDGNDPEQRRRIREMDALSGGQ